MVLRYRIDSPMTKLKFAGLVAMLPQTKVLVFPVVASIRAIWFPSAMIEAQGVPPTQGKPMLAQTSLALAHVV